MKKDIAKAEAGLLGTTALHDDQIAPEIGTEMTHAIVDESHVDVEFRRYTHNNARYVRIKVFTPFKKGLFRFTDINVAGNTREAMARKCDLAAGVLAEQIIQMYGVGARVDPVECAKLARKHFLELCEVAAKQNTQDASV